MAVTSFAGRIGQQQGQGLGELLVPTLLPGAAILDDVVSQSKVKQRELPVAGVKHAESA